MNVSITTSRLPEKRREEAKQCFNSVNAETKEGVYINFLTAKVLHAQHEVWGNMSLEKTAYLRAGNHTFTVQLHDKTIFDLVVRVSK